MGKASEYPTVTPAADSTVYGNKGGDFVQFPIDDLPGAASTIGLFTDIPSMALPESAVYIRTSSHRAPQIPYANSGAAWYIYDTAVDAAYVAANPYTSTISVNGRGYRLDLEQQLTWEMLGAPNEGSIVTASISGSTITFTGRDSGTIAVGHTITAAGGTGAVAAGTILTSLVGVVGTVNIPQTVASCAMVLNDSYPYVAAASQLGSNGILSRGSHWFSQTPVVQNYPVRWYGPGGTGPGGAPYKVTWYTPAGYGALVVAPPGSTTVNAQGDITFIGNVIFGGSAGSEFEHLRFQVGAGGAIPTTSVNNRPAVGVYSTCNFTNIAIEGADGDGLYVFGDGPTCIADNCVFKNMLIQYCYGNGVQTEGGDANLCLFEEIQTFYVNRSGIYEHGFLANRYVSCHSRNTGSSGTVVRRSNNLYFSIQDGNLNKDPLTQTGWWELWTASVGADTWSNATTYHVGAVYRSSGGANVTGWYDCYSESGYPPALFQAHSGLYALNTVYGGQHGAGFARAGRANNHGASGYAGTFESYNDSGYGFSARSNSTGGNVGFLAQNQQGGLAGPNAHGGYDVSEGGTTVSIPIYARYSSEGVNSHRAGVLSAWNNADTQVKVVYWDGEANVFGPVTTNVTSLGIATNLWANVYAVNYVGSGNISTSAGTIGYATGAGGAVAQATSRTTGVTLNKAAGAITLVSAAGSATWQSFTVANSLVAATDTIIVSQKSGTDKYMASVTAVGAGSFEISFATTGGTTTDQPVFNFSVIKAVAT